MGMLLTLLLVDLHLYVQVYSDDDHVGDDIGCAHS